MSAESLALSLKIMFEAGLNDGIRNSVLENCLLILMSLTYTKTNREINSLTSTASYFINITRNKFSQTYS